MVKLAMEARKHDLMRALDWLPERLTRTLLAVTDLTLAARGARFQGSDGYLRYVASPMP